MIDRTLGPSASPSVAVIGAGIAGTACAAALRRSGLNVSLFDKSRGVGGRMATRRIELPGEPAPIELDHGAQHFGARHPRFRAAIERAVKAGAAQPWRPRIHEAWPARPDVRSYVATPHMSALCRHLLGDLMSDASGEPKLHLQTQVQRLHRQAGAWQLVLADGRTVGPFDQVVLAMPPAQAAALLVGHQDAWAEALSDVRMEPCWTLMAVTQEVDWPWDAAVPDKGPLAWIARNDRKPGRRAPAGVACWVAHATPEWTSPRLELPDTRGIVEALQRALQSAVGAAQPLQWLHCSVHRWRYAVPGAAVLGTEAADSLAWWDAERGLGVCGDFLGGSADVESAWRSGDELADALAAWLDADLGQPVEA